MSKTVRVDEAVHARLTTLQIPGESLSDTMARVLEEYNPFAGYGDWLSRIGATPQLEGDLEASNRYVP